MVECAMKEKRCQTKLQEGRNLIDMLAFKAEAAAKTKLQETTKFMKESNGNY